MYYSISEVIIMQLSANEFQSKCLEVIDHAIENHEEVIITKNGKPVIKFVSLEETTPRSFGYLKGSVKIHGDIISPINESWEAKRFMILIWIGNIGGTNRSRPVRSLVYRHSLQVLETTFNTPTTKVFRHRQPEFIAPFLQR